MIGWKEFLYFRMLNHESWWYIPSQSLLDLYDKDHDLRYRYHMVKGILMTGDLPSRPTIIRAMFSFSKDRIPSGPTVAEMLLIKAECLARTNRPGEAIAALNQLRAKRMEPGPWVDLVAANQDDAIAKVLAERRREMPFTQRWFDIRRWKAGPVKLGAVITGMDIVDGPGGRVYNRINIETRVFSEKMYLFPVPLSEINRYPAGTPLEQNPLWN